ncbi:MAG: glycosyltransferase family 2 protein, partial [Arthrospira platensis]
PLSAAIASTYDFSQAQAKWVYRLSPLADPLAVLRLLHSATQRATLWRGRYYGSFR